MPTSRERKGLCDKENRLAIVGEKGYCRTLVCKREFQAFRTSLVYDEIGCRLIVVHGVVIELTNAFCQIGLTVTLFWIEYLCISKQFVGPFLSDDGSISPDTDDGSIVKSMP